MSWCGNAARRAGHSACSSQETVCAAVLVGAAASGRRDGPRQRGIGAACTPYNNAAFIPRPTVRGAYAHLACERITVLRREPASWRRGEPRVRDRLQQRMTWCANAARGAGHSACSRQRATRTKQRRALPKNPTSTVPTLQIGGMRQIRQRAARTAARASGAKCCAVAHPEHDPQPDHAL
jgi:hypothetical protein